MAEMTRPLQDDIDMAEPISEVGQMSQGKLMTLRFRRNKLAMVGTIGLLLMYIIVALAPFLAPNEYTYQNLDNLWGEPSHIRLGQRNGGFGLYTYEMTTILDKENFTWVQQVNKDVKMPIKFFVKGDPYKLLGFIDSDLHLFGLEGAEQRLYPMGADQLGRDMLARTLVGGQVSMTVGLVGVALSIILGSILGTMSGYYGGFIDDVMQRIIELIMAFPTVPLWAALAAALPNISESFTALDRYFLITLILSLVQWTGLARQLRAKVLSYQSADFTQAALAAGASDARIIFVHMLPNAASHIIVVAAMAVPGMILGETSLSFLGLGILPPMVSWGALLRQAQQVVAVIDHPWVLIPGVAVILAVLFFSFLGDGLRDAVDPYSI